MDTFEILKFSLEIFSTKIYSEDNHTILDNNNVYIYNSNTGLVDSIYSKDLIGNSSITNYRYDINSVTFEDIQMPNLFEYTNK